MDYPSALSPIANVDPEKDKKDVSYGPRNADDKFVYDLYEAGKYEGPPVGLQVVGCRHIDEKVLVALREIEHALRRCNRIGGI